MSTIQPCSTLAEALNALSSNDTAIHEAQKALQALIQRKDVLLQMQIKLQHETLCSTISKSDLGFTNSARPIAALLVHRCLMHWGCLSETENPGPFPQLAIAIQQQLESEQTPTAMPDSEGKTQGKDMSLDFVNHSAYWLAVTSTLLALLNNSVHQHKHHALQLQLQTAKSRRWNIVEQPSQASNTQSPPKPAASSWFAFIGLSKAKMKRATAPVEQKPWENGLGPNTPRVHSENLDSRAPSMTSISTNSAVHLPMPPALQQHSSPPRVPPLRVAASARFYSQPLYSQNGSFMLNGPSINNNNSFMPFAVDLPTPAQEFRHQVDMFVLQAYGLVRDTVKKQLASILPCCVLAPSQTVPQTAAVKQTSFGKQAASARLDPSEPGVRFTLSDSESVNDAKSPNAFESDEGDAEAVVHVGQRIQCLIQGEKAAGSLQAWEKVIQILQSTLAATKAQHVPRILVKCLFAQLFRFINLQLFNQLLLRPECCCATNARYMLAGLKLLDHWIMADCGESMLQPLYQELRHARQAALFLVTPGKSKLGVEDIVDNLCSALTTQQVYRLCTTYWDDASTQAMLTTQMSVCSLTASASLTPPLTPTTSRLQGGSFDASANPPPLPISRKSMSGLGGSTEQTQSLPAMSSVSSVFAQVSAAQMAAECMSEPIKNNPLFVPDMVSGEVLEALQELGTDDGNATINNGGLVVTFLLEDDVSPIIAPEGQTAKEVLAFIDGPDLYGPLPLPPQLNTADCPASEFMFVTHPVAMPDHLAAN